MQHKTRLYAVGALAAAVSFALALAINDAPWHRSAAALPSPAAISGLPDFTALVSRNADAVVNISSERGARGDASSDAASDATSDWPDPPGFSDPGTMGEWLRRFFEHGLPRPRGGALFSLGSGFIISPDGYILTNAHVVDGAMSVTVKLNDQRELNARVVGTDPLSDVALLKVAAKGLPIVEVGDARSLRVGQWVLAIGSPFGFDHSASQGIVSALRRNLPDGAYVPFIQTDVPINPGNSGGPLIDLAGRVVGINSQIYSKSGGYMGVAFAIPVDIAMDVAKQLKTQGHVTRGWLGVSVQDMNQDLAGSFGLAKPEGALVAEVMHDSPAEKAGLKAGDVILAFDAHKLQDSGDLPPLVAAARPGQAATLEVLRDGRRREFRVEVAPLRQAKAEPTGRESAGPVRLDLGVENLTPAELKSLGLDHGVRVTEVGAGPAWSAGVQPGDILLSLNRQRLNNVEQLRDLVRGLPGDKPASLQIQRDGSALFLAIRPREGRGRG
jgi:serine protease Do